MSYVKRVTQIGMSSASWPELKFKLEGWLASWPAAYNVKGGVYWPDGWTDDCLDANAIRVEGHGATTSVRDLMHLEPTSER